MSLLLFQLRNKCQCLFSELSSFCFTQRLVKLKSDGTELVTNVHVAADARESTRRLEEEEQRRQR